jgi:hypothetical protein
MFLVGVSHLYRLIVLVKAMSKIYYDKAFRVRGVAAWAAERERAKKVKALSEPTTHMSVYYTP